MHTYIQPAHKQRLQIRPSFLSLSQDIHPNHIHTYIHTYMHTYIQPTYKQRLQIRPSFLYVSQRMQRLRHQDQFLLPNSNLFAESHFTPGGFLLENGVHVSRRRHTLHLDLVFFEEILVLRCEPYYVYLACICI